MTPRFLHYRPENDLAKYYWPNLHRSTEGRPNIRFKISKVQSLHDSEFCVTFAQPSLLLYFWRCNCTAAVCTGFTIITNGTLIYRIKQTFFICINFRQQTLNFIAIHRVECATFHSKQNTVADDKIIAVYYHFSRVPITPFSVFHSNEIYTFVTEINC